MKHRQLEQRIMRTLQEDYGNDIRLIPRETGLFLTLDGKRKVYPNPVGQADIDGFLRVLKHGKMIPCYFCIEAKVGSDRLNPYQKVRQEELGKLGVIYHVIRDTDFDEGIAEFKRKVWGRYGR